jgi:hypothetical protein
MVKIPKIRGRRRNGGFGHCTAKYRKHPAIQHVRNLGGRRAMRRAIKLRDPKPTVREACAAFVPPGRAGRDLGGRYSHRFILKKDLVRGFTFLSE